MSGPTRRRRILIAVILLQVVVLVGAMVFQGERIANGTRVRVAVQPVDPIDLARGAYNDLRYDFEDLHVPDGSGPVFVLLRKPDAAGDQWRVIRITEDADQLDDVDAWIRLDRDDDGDLDTSPISTFYGSAERSKQLETELRDGGTAVLSLDEDGSPSVVDVVGR
ncbi:MAG: hypothetical protein JWM25_632 [Thermoleophilia bacterium]|nr:hypothetical protein [Thermoleophilia bacterium]MCZ4496049.1 hypothetical protein [Thermoleophilia bacterium]